MIQPHAKTLVQQVGRLLDHDTTYDNEKIWMIAQSKNDPGLQQAIKGSAPQTFTSSPGLRKVTRSALNPYQN